jgi:hypothetical protein
MQKNKLHLLIFLLCITMTAAAQRPWLSTGIHGTHSFGHDKAMIDTLFHGFDTIQPTLFAAPVGGWVSGTNGYRDAVKAQEFKVYDSLNYTITDFIFWFAIKKTDFVSDSSKIVYNMYKIDSVQQISSLYFLVPGTVILTDTVSFSQVQAGLNFQSGINVWTLPSPTPVFENYAVGFDMSVMNPKDTIVMFTNNDGNPAAEGFSWEKWQGKWNTLSAAWGLNIDYAIFPVVDYTNSSIENQPFIQSLRAEIYPNPAQGFTTMKVESQLSGTLKILLYDASGRPLKQLVQANTTAAGISEHTIDVNGIAAGTYYAEVRCGDKHRIFRKLIIR